MIVSRARARTQVKGGQFQRSCSKNFGHLDILDIDSKYILSEIYASIYINLNASDHDHNVTSTGCTPNEAISVQLNTVAMTTIGSSWGTSPLVDRNAKLHLFVWTVMGTQSHAIKVANRASLWEILSVIAFKGNISRAYKPEKIQLVEKMSQLTCFFCLVNRLKIPPNAAT